MNDYQKVPVFGNALIPSVKESNLSACYSAKAWGLLSKEWVVSMYLDVENQSSELSNYFKIIEKEKTR